MVDHQTQQFILVMITVPSEDTARERIREFEATSADLLITACAYCKEIFRKVLPESERERVKDLTELVAERT